RRLTGTDARVSGFGADGRIPARLSALPAVHHHRPHRIQHSSCHGDDDGFSRDDLHAVEAVPVRHGGWLDAPDPGPGALLSVTGMQTQDLVSFMTQALYLVLWLSLPPIAAAAIVG